MYAALWRVLPGPVWLRIIIVVALLVGVFFLLMKIVFPWLEPLLPWTDVAVAASGLDGVVPSLAL